MARDTSLDPTSPPNPPSTYTTEINPASCLSTELWRGEPGQGAKIRISGFWEKVDRHGNCILNDSCSVKLCLVIMDSTCEIPYKIGPLSYLGTAMEFGPYDFPSRIMASVNDLYFHEHRQHFDSPLKATVEPIFRTRRPRRSRLRFETNQAA
tara:strand:+ start:18612 stop:19067 length:456 start_codon:yes stop_codon:yes gene_type:complete